MAKLRVLYFDIETAPYIATIWHPKQRYVTYEQMLEDSYMLSWAAKWDGQEEVMSDVLTSREAVKGNDTRIVTSLAKLFREADAVVAHNLKRFDYRRLNARVAKHQMEPLGPYTPIDTLTIAAKDLGLPYYKLDYLAQHFGLGEKIDTEMSLWLRCMVGDEDALQEMVTYNKHDVVLLEKIFYYMLPYANSVPRLFEADWDDQWLCNYCGAEGKQSFQLRGPKRTQAYSYHRYRCKKCGKYGRTRNRILGHKNKLVPL